MSPSRVHIVLSRTSHPGNIGAAARAMLTMGFERLTLVAPKRFPDPAAVALASGATAVLDTANVVATLDDALAGASCVIGMSARRREFAGRVIDVRAAAALAFAPAAGDGDVAFVFGTEMTGLTNDELSRCGVVGVIPSNLRYASLNLAAAVQVTCYELRMQMAGDGTAVWRAPRFAPASHDEIEGLHAHTQRTLTAIEFLDPAMPRRLMPRLRRLFARAGLEKEEINILRGILARIDTLVTRR
ncbi:MAG: RNA methyltransferase [Betaproteobacteria bacterium]